MLPRYWAPQLALPLKLLWVASGDTGNALEAFIVQTRELFSDLDSGDVPFSVPSRCGLCLPRGSFLLASEELIQHSSHSVLKGKENDGFRTIQKRRKSGRLFYTQPKFDCAHKSHVGISHFAVDFTMIRSRSLMTFFRLSTMFQVRYLCSLALLYLLLIFKFLLKSNQQMCQALN